jgi:histidine decarboxylase
VSGLPEADQARLDELLRTLDERAPRTVGYPGSGRFDYSPLLPLLKYPINNIGDPFTSSSFPLNTHAFERDVVRWFAELYHAPADGAWGYVTHGGTEGNLYALFLARELHPDGLVYFSEETHYSIPKLLRLLGLKSIMIRALPSGALDPEDLEESLRLHREVPAIVIANVGTTMKGAQDDLQGILAALDAATQRRHYLHVDAALHGMILPFSDGAPVFDFRLPVDSIAVSGHKMIGSPIPCGVVLARREHVDRVARSVEYVGSLDTTISGSRNALTPVFLWAAIRSLGTEGFRQLVADCLALAAYAKAGIDALGLHAWTNPHSNIVVFDRPSDALARKWGLALQRRIAHLITMPHVTREAVDGLISDLRSERSARP